MQQSYDFGLSPSRVFAVAIAKLRSREVELAADAQVLGFSCCVMSLQCASCYWGRDLYTELDREAGKGRRPLVVLEAALW